MRDVSDSGRWRREQTHPGRLAGHDVTTAALGPPSRSDDRKWCGQEFALVTDVNLKGPMKGWEIARLVRKIDPAFPVVHVTGAAADECESEGRRFFSAPTLSLRDVLDAVKDACDVRPGNCLAVLFASLCCRGIQAFLFPLTGPRVDCRRQATPTRPIPGWPA
jgi:hypothetical protein